MIHVNPNPQSHYIHHLCYFSFWFAYHFTHLFLFHCARNSHPRITQTLALAFQIDCVEMLELDMSQWSPGNQYSNATQHNISTTSAVGASMSSVASAGSGIGSIQLTNAQVHGNAPTASPEYSGLTPTNTGSSGMSNNLSALASSTTTTTKREPYLRNWFASAASSSPQSANAAGGAAANAPASQSAQ